MDYDIENGWTYSDEHGRANYDYVNNYIGLSSVPLSYFMHYVSDPKWRTIFALRDYGEGYFTWDGSKNTTTWSDPDNWTVGVSGSGVPTTSGHVIIPNAGTTPLDPVLPSENTIINTMSIENGGILTMGSSTLTIQNSFSGGWEDQNPQGNDPGTSTVVFNRPNTTISGNARFYNVQIAAIDALTDTIADITNQTGSTMKIGGAITKTGLGTGKWYADVFGATVEYNGGNQTILLPDGSLRYHNLILSGTGTKTLPSGLSMHGDFIITDSTTAVAGGAVTTVGTMSVGPRAKYTAGTYPHTNGHFIIYSDATGTGSLIANTPFSGTVERYIPNELKWHFLSSPVLSQAIWPEFAPTPVYDVDHYVFDQLPYNWDFYYWNPNANTTNQLYWVNLRKNSSGDYNDQGVDAAGSNAGFGATVPPAMTVGRGYLTAYGSDWNISSGSPVTHNFTGTLNYGNRSLNLTYTETNSFNLVGNPYPSAIDWKAESGWDRAKLATNDYWIYDDASGNYGVFNYNGATGTHGTTKDIAPMQAFFVKASASGAVTMTSSVVQLHSNQPWLKEGSEVLNVLRFKLTTKANPYYDEMNLEVDPGLANDGSEKFWSMHAEAPEIYAIRNGGYYSIERRSAVDDQTVIPVGIKAGISTSYTLQVTGTESFFYAKNIMLEDLKTGAVQDLKTNPSYTFTATPGDAAERFHLRFSGPYGVDEVKETSPVRIYTYGNDLVVKSNTPEPVTGDVYLRNLPGQQVFTQRIDGVVTRMTLNLPAGCYIATLVTKDRIFSKKVIVN
jgi:hypothetical protein